MRRSSATIVITRDGIEFAIDEAGRLEAAVYSWASLGCYKPTWRGVAIFQPFKQGSIYIPNSGLSGPDEVRSLHDLLARNLKRSSTLL